MIPEHIVINWQWFCTECKQSCTSDNPCDCCDIAQALEDDYPLDTEQDPLR